MACLKLEVEDVDQQMFDLDPTVTVKTEEQKEIKDVLLQNEVGPERNFNMDCGYGDVITIAPLGDVLVKEESVGASIECNESVSVDTPEQEASCQPCSAYDTQPVELVGLPVCVLVLPNPSCARNISSSTEAEPMRSTSHSQTTSRHQETASSESSPVTYSKAHAIDTGMKFNRCIICGVHFRHKSLLKRHLLVHTRKEPVNRFECQICGKHFNVSADLKCHMTVHRRERPHKCQVCGKAFAARSALKLHTLIHNEEKPVKCETCGKGFRTVYGLKQHMLAHRDERPYKCTICGKGVKTHFNLKRHLLTHTKERPHKCQICGKGFTSSHNLKKHSLTHTNKRPVK